VKGESGGEKKIKKKLGEKSSKKRTNDVAANEKGFGPTARVKRQAGGKQGVPIVGDKGAQHKDGEKKNRRRKGGGRGLSKTLWGYFRGVGGKPLGF